jgi:hypothetical protein
VQKQEGGVVAIEKSPWLDFYHQMKKTTKVDLQTGGVYRTPLDLPGVQYSQQLPWMMWKVAGEEGIRRLAAAFHNDEKVEWLNWMIWRRLQASRIVRQCEDRGNISY